MYACAHWNKRNAKKIRSLSQSYQQVWTGVSFGKVFVEVIHKIIWCIGSDLFLKGFMHQCNFRSAKESYVVDT